MTPNKKRVLLALISLAGLAAFAETPKKDVAPDAKPASGAKPKAVKTPPGVPANARQIDVSTWTATDDKGKQWFYRVTPFGAVKRDVDPSKVPDNPPQAAGEGSSRPADGSPKTKVTDLGDSYAFEKSTAYGVSKWTRKKSQLTSEEKALVESGASGSARDKK